MTEQERQIVATYARLTPSCYAMEKFNYKKQQRAITHKLSKQEL